MYPKNKNSIYFFLLAITFVHGLEGNYYHDVAMNNVFILAIHDIISSFLNFHWIDNTGFNLEETDYYGDYGDYGNYDIFDPVTQHDGCSGNVAKHNLCDVNSFPEEHLTQMTDFANLLKKNFCCKDHSYVALDECQVVNDCSNN